MPTPLTEAQVVEYSKTLEADYATYRKEELHRLELYGLYAIPNLPKDLTRGQQVNVLSPDLMDAMESIRSDLLPMLTEISVLPLARTSEGTIPPKDKIAADQLEHALAACLGALDHDRRLSKDMIFRQLINRTGIFVLECEPITLPGAAGLTPEQFKVAQDAYMATRSMWQANDVDPVTAAWIEKSGDPTVLGRRYKQTVLEIEKNYSRRKSEDGLSGDLTIKDNKWNFQALSDDYRPEAMHRVGGLMGFGQKQLREAEMIWLDDGNYVYHMALNPGSTDQGKLLWYAPSYIGRCSAFLVPGIETPLREPQDRRQPYLYPLMVITEELNMIRTIRATASRNRSSQMAYAPYDPDTVRQLRAAGIDIPTVVTWEPNKIPYVMTKEIKEREIMVDADLEKNVIDLKEDRERYRPQNQASLADPAVLKESTAAAILNATETAMKKLGPLVTAFDSAKRQALEGVIYSVKTGYKGPYGKFSFISGEATTYTAGSRKPAKGDYSFMDADSLDFPFRISVSTKMVTMAQASAAYEYRAGQRARGDATDEMVWEAANITDIEAFRYEKAVEDIVASNKAWADMQVQAILAEEVARQLGIVLPLPPTAGPPAPQGDASTRPPAPGGAAPAGAPESMLAGLSGNRTSAPEYAGPPSGSEGVSRNGANPR